jgi:hypothetical protein
MQLPEYHAAIAQWVADQRARLSDDPDYPASHDTLAAQIGYHAGERVSGEVLRRWETGLLKRRISAEKEEAIAAYCREVGLDLPNWLRKPQTQSAKHPIDFISQAQPDQAGEIAQIVAAGIDWLARHGYPARQDYPASKAGLIEAITHSQARLIAGGGILAPRLTDLMGGDNPTIGEALVISQLFTPPGDADRIVALYAPTTAKRSANRS